MDSSISSQQQQQQSNHQEGEVPPSVAEQDVLTPRSSGGEVRRFSVSKMPLTSRKHHPDIMEGVPESPIMRKKIAAGFKIQKRLKKQITHQNLQASEDRPRFEVLIPSYDISGETGIKHTSDHEHPLESPQNMRYMQYGTTTATGGAEGTSFLSFNTLEDGAAQLRQPKQPTVAVAPFEKEDLTPEASDESSCLSSSVVHDQSILLEHQPLARDPTQQDYSSDFNIILNQSLNQFHPNQLNGVHSENEKKKPASIDHSSLFPQEGIPYKRSRKNSKAHKGDMKRPYHPYAERPSPWEETKQTVALGLTTVVQFAVIDVLVNGVLYYIWKVIEFVLLSPLALIGLLIEFFRSCFLRLKRKIVVEPPRKARSNFLESLQEDLTLPKKDLIIAIRLLGLLVDLKSVPQGEDLLDQSSMKSSGGGGDEASSFMNESPRRVIKIYKRRQIESFLRFLGEIKAQVFVFEDSPKLSEEETIQIVRQLAKSIEGDVELKPVYLTPKETANDLLKKIKEQQSLNRLERRLILIDKEGNSSLSHLQLKKAGLQSNLLLVGGNLARPQRWREVIEQVSLSKGEDVRKTLPAIIQMQSYYPQ